MHHHVPGVTVLATFDDLTAAEIACGLLADGSLTPDAPELAGVGRWRVQLRGLTPDLANRASVVLKRARASETLTVGEAAAAARAPGRVSAEVDANCPQTR